VIILIIAAVYLTCGAIFAVPFVVAGVGRIDPHAKRGSWGFRILITPGTVLLWPLLAARWVRGVNAPPEEKTAHRCAARTGGDR
jgi:hypothetical protein